MQSLRIVLLGFLMVLVSPALTSCEKKYGGTLNVYHDFSIKSHKSKKRVADFQPGSYAVELEYKNISKKLHVEVPGKPEVKIKIPKIARRNLKNAIATPIHGSEIGQDWDADVRMETTVHAGPSYESQRSCILRYEYCYGYYDRQPVYGIKTVLVHDETTTETAYTRFFARQQNLVLADMTAHHITTQVIFDRDLSDCY